MTKSSPRPASSKPSASRKPSAAGKPPALDIQMATNLPLDKLEISTGNVRQLGAEHDIAALADSIARHGLLQSLSVRPILDEDGAETGRYQVQAGGRRLRALNLLAKQKRIAGNAPIPCIVKTGGILEADSLVENNQRAALHPLDQFRAFAALRGRGQSEDDIAAAHGVTPAVVRQRLRLAAASPALLEAYASDTIDLKQLMAFCITDDHVRQDQVLHAIQTRQVAAQDYNIRRLLTETSIEATDNRAIFVGLDAYRAAGGTITRDLFAPDDGGWLDNPEIVTRLIGEKLAAERERLLAEGWSWVNAAEDIDYTDKLDLCRLTPKKEGLTRAEQTRYDALEEEADAIRENLPGEAALDDGHDDQRRRLAEIERELADLNNKPPTFSAKNKARSGVLVTIGHEGQLAIEYGFTRAEDDPDATDRDEDADDESEGDEEESAAQAHDDAGTGDLPERLVEDLTAQHTLALRSSIASDFDAAFVAVLHALALPVFYHRSQHTCLQITLSDRMSGSAQALGTIPAVAALEALESEWTAKLPDTPEELWHALVALPQQQRADLFAYCAAMSINAVRAPHQQRSPALAHADQLASAVRLDMVAAGWTATAQGYLARLTKAQIVDAVREAKGESAAQLIDHLKKGDMAKEAERLLAGTGWLPPPLRASAAEPADTSAALPDFLQSGDEDADSLPQAAE